ncbi:hypothetical protein Tco_0435349 [Tanacetum coccineum]
MTAPTIPVSVGENLGDRIDIRMDIIYLEPVAAIAFLAAAAEEMSTLRFRMGMAKAENAFLHGKIKTIEAIKTFTRSQRKGLCMEKSDRLASVKDPRDRTREHHDSSQELVTSQLRHHP